MAGATSGFGVSRRGFLGLAGAAAAAAALAACAGAGGGSANSAGGDAKTINFWSPHPGKAKDTETELVRRFTAQNPDLKVNLIDAGANYEETSQKFNAALTGGDLPDVVVLSDVWWFNYALTGAIEPLDGHFAAAGVNPADYVDSLLADYQFDGKHYALPYARSTPLFYYNKELWAKASLPDRGPASWQEFDEWGPELQRAVGAGKLAHGLGNGKDYLAWTYQGPIWTFGGSYSDQWALKFNDEKTIQAGNFLRDMVNTKRYAAVSNDIVGDFSAGLLASTVSSTGDLTGITKNAKFDFGTAFLPAPQGVPGCPTGGSGLAIPSKISDARKLNALKFIDFVTNPANTAYFSQNVGYMPVRKSAVDDASEKDFLAKNPRSQTAIDQLPQTKSQNYARVFVPGGDQIIGTGLERIASQNADVTATFADITNQLQQIIDRQITPKLPK
jgi:sn-glycerol 3-phosphate transport system substrate-binding protein